jgi:hypothetical protein
MNTIENPQRRMAKYWLMLAAFGVLMALFPFLISMDMMNWGFAIVFFSFLPIVAGLVGAFFYFQRARTLDNMLKGEKVLAHWRYSADEWDRFASEEAEEEKSEKTGLFLVITAFALLFGFLFLLFAPDREAGRWVFVAMLGLIVIIAITAFLSIRFSPFRSRGRPTEAYVSDDGVFINGTLHTWNVPGTMLSKAEFQAGPPSLLEIEYSFVTRYGMDFATVRVPVPQGEEAAARQVAQRLRPRLAESGAAQPDAPGS